ncbi:MAG: DHHA1 domain-containing protein [Candidatus Saganbacteria bacterium]|nr:DHHA1 domain-containing protein [Candidatus Saganbacteria bacterium]
MKVSFRSKTDLDVNKIARQFGGGGHRAASGCEIKGSMGKAEKMVLDAVKKALENNS